MAEAQFSRPAISTPFGKCTRVAKTLIPQVVGDKIAERARSARVPEAVVIRNALMVQFLGQAMVEASLAEHFRSTTESGTETAGGVGEGA